MAWDSSRRVPWARLCREWIVYVCIMILVFLGWTVVTGNDLRLATIAGLLASGPMYVAFGAILAKFGYQRKTFRDLRTARASAPRGSSSSNSTSGGARRRPPVTSRTSTGPSQHRPNNKRRRR
jgi:hypothetical protein